MAAGLLAIARLADTATYYNWAYPLRHKVNLYLPDYRKVNRAGNTSQSYPPMRATMAEGVARP